MAETTPTVSATAGQGRATGVSERLRRAGRSLTPAERRIAAVVLEHPQTVAFGTVADVSEAAGVGGATVVRLATKLGYEGYTDLQASVRADLVGRLRPAAARIREQRGGDQISAHLVTETANLRDTLTALDPAVLRRAVELLADPQRAVVVTSGESSRGIVSHFADELDLLRPGVQLVGGSPVAAHRAVACHPAATVMVVVDVHRYDQWILDLVRSVSVRGWEIIAVTDSPLSPLAEMAGVPFVAAAHTVGPFDSHVGVLAVLSLLVNTTATLLAADATTRLDAVESAWHEVGALAE